MVDGLVDFLENNKIKVFSNQRLIEYEPTHVQISLNIQQISEKIIADIPVIINNVPKKIRVFPSPQTVSLTVIGGVQRIASIDPEEIKDGSSLIENWYSPREISKFP